MATIVRMTRIVWFVLSALLHSLLGVLLWPLFGRCVGQRRERPIVTGAALPLPQQVFEPSPWAPTGCAQTLFGNLLARGKHPYTRRDVVALQDGGQAVLDWKDAAGLEEARQPLLFVCPGIAGSSASGAALRFTDAARARGWRSVVYNRRGHAAAAGHGASRCLTDAKPFPMHCDAEDMAQVVEHVQAAYPDSPKQLVGLSAGACLAMKYLGSQHARNTTPFAAAVSISNAQALVPLMEGLKSRPCADALLVSALQGLLQKNVASVSPKMLPPSVTDHLMTCHSVADFEGRLMLPLYRDTFASLEAYYEANSCHAALSDIQPGLPVLFIGALDDPLIPPHLHLHAVRYAASGQNPRATSVLTERGGHLGWLSGWTGRRWDMQLAFQFLEHHALASGL